MGKTQTCILCEIVYNSKQEMDEHMRSMLHHRELENLKGRDCGHECRACGVTVKSLTEYADHISSPMHKQRVEAFDHQISKVDQDEGYFDKEMVELIEKRKKFIRQEEAALKRAREERETMRKWQDIKEQWHDPRQWRHQQGGSWGPRFPNFPLPSRGGLNTNLHEPHRGPEFDCDSWNRRQIRSATWHAEGPPDLQRWQSFDGRGRSLHSRGNYWGGRPGMYAGCPPQQRNQSAWSNTEGNRGNFDRQNDLNWQHSKANHCTAVSRIHHLQKPHHSTESQKKFFQKQEGCAENDPGKGKGKCDKTHRWAPYPPTLLGDPLSQSDVQPSTDNVNFDSPGHSNKRDLNVNNQDLEQKNDVEECRKQSPIKRNDSSGKTQRLNHTSSPPSSLPSPSQKLERPTKHSEKSVAADPGSVTNLSRTSSQDSVTSKASKHSHSSSRSPPAVSTDQEREHLLSVMLRKAKENLLHNHTSVEKSATEDDFRGAELHIQEDELLEVSELSSTKDCSRSKKKSKEHNGRRKEEEHNEKSKEWQSHGTEVAVPSDCSTNDINMLSLQSLQVSTSTMDREDEDDGAEREEDLVQDHGTQATDEGMSDSEGSRTSHSLATVPSLKKLALPASLTRDLNRHIGSKGKGIAHEPNLNIARRFRNVSGTHENEKDSGLKPTLRHLISSSASRRNVNWDQVYQEVHRKKQEQGKGLPRFGIEMVPKEPEGTSHMEDDVPLCEGFHWDSVADVSVFPRKRNMSESSVVTYSTTASRSLLREAEPTSVMNLQNTAKARLQTAPSPKEKDCDDQRDNKGIAQAKEHVKEMDVQKPVQDTEPVDAESSCMSSAELNGAKKRRAVGDVASPEIPNAERKNKRLKIKPKKELSQLDELLAVSLREEELNSSLQAVDSSLIQARSALQSAYMEVQRLLMVKQQVTAEMSSLRTKRIEILQGLQGGSDSPTRNCDENLSTSPILPLPSLASPENNVKPSYPATTSSILSPSPTSSPPVFAIKQERLSPITVNPAREPTGSPLSGLHSTTPEQSAAAATETDVEPVSLDANIKCSLNVKLCQKNIECAQDQKSELSPDHQAYLASQEHTQDLNPVSPKCSPPHNSPDAKAGKRIRKLKKKRVLRNTQTSKQPDISDSEQDSSQPVRPVRKLRSRRRNIGSCYSPPAAAEVKEESMEVTCAPDHLPETKGPTLASAGKETQDSDSSELEMVELPQSVPMEVVNLDSDEEERNLPQVSKESAAETAQSQNLACNEVTSTSEIDTSSVVTSCESAKNVTLAVIKESKASSEASSDAGEEDMPTEGSFEGHQEAVNGMQIHNGLLYTCSGDRTIRAFNLLSRKCVAVFDGHSSKVNCLVVSSGPGVPQRLYSGSSDQTIRCYNIKTRECVQQLGLPDRVLCLHNRWKVLYVGLGNGSVVTFSLKNNKQLDVFDCHGPRAVSCLATAQEGARRVLLVGSYDTTISVRDAKSGLLLRTLEGHTKTVLCMKVVNDLVFSGSSDQSVHAHNIHTGELVRVYKGHSHAVTVVAILGKVMVTACLDKLVRVFELQSHDRLQVYGGHSDMVMCMVIHKSMIYTGCYNGSVQAVRLNLLQNYRCWWHGCSLVFGVMEHLQQHLLNDHTSHTQQTLKCRWKNCDSFFNSRNGFKQAVQAHMQKHAEEDSKLES
ncbi:zinc finger protein 106 isoform X3 [Hemibagrus wyckioides]|nr:zinc finger protein 106 isoform X3 [Hemibagrus wyckioides]XP_058254961.1 zinc finger protein 106 isoform X3 [Hemibagrus wyckioides]